MNCISCIVLPFYIQTPGKTSFITFSELSDWNVLFYVWQNSPLQVEISYRNGALIILQWTAKLRVSLNNAWII